jgi:hypothetical protein
VYDLTDGVVDRGSPVSANRAPGLVKHLFGSALEREIVDANPAAATKPPR